MTSSDDSTSDLRLAQKAVDGDSEAQRRINAQIEPIINFQTGQFCKRYCRGRSSQLKCSLIEPIGSPSADATGCEWGNASYGWMLDDLARPERLAKYQARNNSRLFGYLYNIANSLPFYERWKDWRFGRRKRVPDYIVEIDPMAAKIFYAMSADQDINMIAAQLSIPTEETRLVARAIVRELSSRQKLYLLDTPAETSLTSGVFSGKENVQDDGHQQDVAVDDDDVEMAQRHTIIIKAWQQLDVVEQFVLEALVVEDQDASDVLDSLTSLDITIKPGISAKDCNRQQLYYFKRKTLDKLQQVLQELGYGLDDFFK